MTALEITPEYSAPAQPQTRAQLRALAQTANGESFSSSRERTVSPEIAKIAIVRKYGADVLSLRAQYNIE